MSVHLDVTISAKNAAGDITENFRQESTHYENPVTVNLTVNNTTAGTAIIQDINTPIRLGFGGDDANGTHLIDWDDSNESHRLMFNYNKNIQNPINPFIVDGSEVDINVSSIYTGSSGSDTIIGGNIADQNATFYYSRVKSSKFFYDNVTGSSMRTPISIVIFCNIYPTCSELSSDIQTSGKTNESHWWLSRDHDTASKDGNITLSVGAGSGTVTPAIANINNADNGVNNSVVVSNTSTTSPSVVDIHLNTSSWLEYDPSGIANPIPFYRVRFIGTSGWTGHGKTGHVVDSNASKKRNNRIGW